MLRRYSTSKAAEGTGLYERRSEIQRELNNLSQKLRTELLEKTSNKFHEDAHTFIVERMQSVLPAPDVLTPATIKYDLKERATVTKLLFEPLDDLGEDEVLQVRVKLV
jgi:hypothetical protein